jgi:predicted alpha/beta hydrolase
MEIVYRDRTTNHLNIFRAIVPSDITFLILPALGVRASYYVLLAQYLADASYNVVTVDWRGQGSSSVRPSRNSDFGYEHLIMDLRENLDNVKSIFPGTKIIAIGHSLGGQISSLFASRFPGELSAVVLITSGSVYYKGWKRTERLKVISAANLFYPISRIFGYFPGEQIGFGGKEAMTVMKDWGKNVFSGKYVLTGSSFDYESNLKKLVIPVLTITVEKDFLVTQKAAENLVTKFHDSSEITFVHLHNQPAEGIHLNHFTWAKNPEYIGPVMINWLKKVF